MASRCRHCMEAGPLSAQQDVTGGAGSVEAFLPVAPSAATVTAQEGEVWGL